MDTSVLISMWLLLFNEFFVNLLCNLITILLILIGFYKFVCINKFPIRSMDIIIIISIRKENS